MAEIPDDDIFNYDPVRVTTLRQAMDEFLSNDAEFERLVAFGVARSKSQSPLEHSLWHLLEKTSGWDYMHGQFKVRSYRIDCVVECDMFRIGLEADGSAYHQDTKKDLRRDIEILSVGGVDEIIRIPFAALRYFGSATLCVLQDWHPDTFVYKPPVTCLSIQEMKEEIERHERDRDELVFDDGFSDWVKDAEVWRVTGNTALAASYENIVHNHNVKPIRRYTASDIPSMRLLAR